VSECPEKWKLDVNDRYQKAVGIITSLSTLCIVIPVLFLRDVLGVDQSESIASILSLWVYVGWALLGISILSSIIYYFSSAKWVKLAWGKPADMFGIPITAPWVERLLDWSYFMMMVGFVGGFICVVLFMVNFTRIL
jgi:hypothetical protein